MDNPTPIKYSSQFVGAPRFTRLVQERLGVGIGIIDVLSHLHDLDSQRRCEAESFLHGMLLRQERLDRLIEFADPSRGSAWTERLRMVEDRRWHSPSERPVGHLRRPCRLCVAASLPLSIALPALRQTVAA